MSNRTSIYVVIKLFPLWRKWLETIMFQALSPNLGLKLKSWNFFEVRWTSVLHLRKVFFKDTLFYNKKTNGHIN